MDCHFRELTSRSHFDVPKAWLGSCLDPSPSLEAVAGRQKQGNVMPESLPGDYSPISLADVLGDVVSAFVTRGARGL
jgi:hypothetical protein